MEHTLLTAQCLENSGSNMSSCCGHSKGKVTTPWGSQGKQHRGCFFILVELGSPATACSVHIIVLENLLGKVLSEIIYPALPSTDEEPKTLV